MKSRCSGQGLIPAASGLSKMLGCEVYIRNQTQTPLCGLHPPPSLCSSHTGSLSVLTPRACSCPRVFAFAIPSAWQYSVPTASYGRLPLVLQLRGTLIREALASLTMLSRLPRCHSLSHHLAIAKIILTLLFTGLSVS